MPASTVVPASYQDVQRVDSSAVQSTVAPRAWATTIRSSPEFAKRMRNLGLSEGDQDLQENKPVLRIQPTSNITTTELHTTAVDLRATVLKLENENKSLKNELHQERQQGKQDLALAVRSLPDADCWLFVD